jgi:hypothetical protein
MVIIAIVFTVIPKIVLTLNKSDAFSIRQDALFNGISMMHLISNMPWDKENVDSRDILETNSTDSKFDCNSSNGYRIGGFVGSRTCFQDLNASSINTAKHKDATDFDNIGDFNNADIKANYYDLNISVSYILDDNNSVFVTNGSNMVVDLNKSNNALTTTNLKNITIIVNYSGKRGKVRRLTQFDYVSANIGQMIFYKREWK